MSANIYQYGLLQYRHSQMLGEVMNIGLLVYFPTHLHLAFLSPKNLTRLRSAYTTIPEKTIEGYFSYFNEQVIAFNDNPELFNDYNINHSLQAFVENNFLPADSSALQFGQYRTSVLYTTDIDHIKNQLYSLYFSVFQHNEVHKKMSHTEKIINLISSGVFKARMETIDTNYFNLMQESVVRNSMLEQFNANPTYHGENFRAVAELKIDKKSYDLCIIDKRQTDNVFKIELKFRFGKLRNNDLAPYLPIEKDFVERKADLFILIVAGGELSGRQSIYQTWGINDSLLKYFPRHHDWQDKYKNGIQLFAERPCPDNSFSASFQTISIQSEQPPYTQYAFFVLSRENASQE